MTGPSGSNLSSQLEAAGTFTVELVSTLAQRGYYRPDHPAARKVADRLFELLKKVTPKGSELSYQVVGTDPRSGLVLEGLAEERIQLWEVAEGSRGKEFVGRFLEILRDGRVVALTLREPVTTREFHAFLGLWMEKIAEQQKTSEERISLSAALSEPMLKAGITQITILGAKELLESRRALSLDVRIVLARLNKELLRLPKLKRVRKLEFTALKRTVVEEVIENVARSHLLLGVLFNSDLAMRGSKLISHREVEGHIIDGMTHDAAVGVTGYLVDRYAELGKAGSRPEEGFGLEPAELRRRITRVAPRLLKRLVASEDPDVVPLIEDAQQKGLLRSVVIPSSMRRKVALQQKVDHFIDDGATVLKGIEECEYAQEYTDRVAALQEILPKLIERGETIWVARILEALHRHIQGKGPVGVAPVIVGNLLRDLGRGEFPDQLLEAAVFAPEADREGIDIGVTLFGRPMIPRLTKLFDRIEEDSDRRTACDLLARIARAEIPELLKELQSADCSSSAQCGIIRVLGKLGARDAVPAILERTHDHDLEVTDECLSAVIEIEAEDAEEHLLRFVDAPDPRIRGRALRRLADLGSTAPRFLNRIKEVVRLRTRAEPELGLPDQKAALSALIVLGATRRGALGSFEKLLLDAILPPLKMRMVPGPMGPRTKLPEIQALILEALGTLGTPVSLRPLEKMSRSKEPALQKAAERALRRVQRRASSA